MPSLKDLANNLNSFRYYSGMGTFSANKLPYTKDRPGGGYSGQPYVKTSLGFNWSPDSFTGGLLGNTSILGNITHTGADLARIGKFFTDVPIGPLWLARQTGLQLMNPKLESMDDRPTNLPISGQGLLTNAANAAINIVNRITNDIGTTRIYNPLGTNTLAQVGVSSIGGHVVRHGVLPFMGEQEKYINVVKQKDKAGNNRLVGLSQNFANPSIPKEGGVIISQYKGGSHSLLGIGSTTIKSAGYVSSLTGLPSDGMNGFIPIPVNILQAIDGGGKTGLPPVAAAAFSAVTPIIGSNIATNIPFNFRYNDFRVYKNLTRTNGTPALPTSDYPKYNMTKRIGRINNGVNATRKANDGINMVSLYYGNGAAGIGKDVKDINGMSITDGSVIRDLIKFRIKVLDNDNPNYGTYLVFRAFFTGDISKDITAKWSPYSYIGRGEEFYAYESTKAVMSFGFTIVAFSKAEMKPIYQKMNYLESSTYPDYKANKMRGNIVELTIGDYIKYQPGIITSLTFTIPEDTNWEIAMDEPENGTDKDMHELPQRMHCNITFTPIYKFLPRRNSQTPFIGIDDTERNGRGGPKDWLVQAVEPAQTTKKKA